MVFSDASWLDLYTAVNACIAPATPAGESPVRQPRALSPPIRQPDALDVPEAELSACGGVRDVEAPDLASGPPVVLAGRGGGWAPG